MSFEGKIIDLTKRSFTPKIGETVFDLIQSDGVDYGIEVGDVLNRKYYIPFVTKGIMDTTLSDSYRSTANQMYRSSLIYSGTTNFECYLLAMDFNRPVNERFYYPRARVLKPIVDDFQALTDKKLNVYGLSMPPRTGKSTLASYYCGFRGGRNPEKSILGISYSSIATNTFYDGTKQLLEDKYTYNFAEIFPDAKIVSTDSKNLTVDLREKHRYKTLSFRSIDGTLTGAVEAGQLLYLDDLIEGYMQARSFSRLETAWAKVTSDILQRRKDGVQMLIIGTRWAPTDPIGMLESFFEGQEDAKFLKIPALNENDESNFQYKYGVGFSTKYYEETRELMNDEVQFSTIYMQNAIEKEGVVFNQDTLNFYDGETPDGEPDCVWMVVDVAYGGGDSLSGPIVEQYGEDYYLSDVVFNKGDKTVTQPTVAGRIISKKVNRVRFEGNNGGDLYMDAVEAILNEHGYKCILSAKKAPSNMSKKTRIETYAPDVRKFHFLHPSKQSPEYKKFMRELCMYNLLISVPHDDAPDSAAQLAAFINEGSLGKATIVGRRTF